MNKDEVLRIAKECGFDVLHREPWSGAPVSFTSSTTALERFAAAIYAKGAEDMRELADDAWADAIQSDCEHGVKSLSESSAHYLRSAYPALACLGETIRALPTNQTNEGDKA